MDIVRPLVISTDDDGPDPFDGRRLEMQVGPVKLESVGRDGNRRWLFLASTALRGELRMVDGCADIRRSEVEEIDAAVHSFVAMLTVACGKTVAVASIAPVIGLLGRDIELSRYCDGVLNIPAARVATHVDNPIDLNDHTTNLLADRLDGVALLAEAISHANALGRYGQLLRLLEHAFGRGIGKFDADLQRYLRLAATRHWFSPSEIQHWVSSRPRVMHADRPDRPIWYQRDVAFTVGRLQEAATDILFNKRNWQSPDYERRQAYVPRRGSLDQAAGIFLTRGFDVKQRVTVFEPFGAFRLYLTGQAVGMVPRGLWAVQREDSVVLKYSGAPDGAEGCQAEPVDGGSARFVKGARVQVYASDDDSVRSPEADP